MKSYKRNNVPQVDLFNSKSDSVKTPRRRNTKKNGKITKAELKRLEKLAKNTDEVEAPREEHRPASFPVAIKKNMAPGVIQVTLQDKRWYFKETKPQEFLAYPSTTWVLDAALPKGYGFNRWLSNLSAEESKRILEEAGERGSRVHAGIEALLRGQKIKFEEPQQFLYNTCFTVEEWQFLMDFNTFFGRFRPKAIAIEQVVINEKFGFAGTADLIGIFDEGLLETFSGRTQNGFAENGKQVTAVVDWKTSSAIHDSHKMQVHAYAESLNVDYAIIVRLGAKNKNGFELFISKIDDANRPRYFETFLHVLEVFKFLHGNETPKLSEIKEMLSLTEEV